MSIKYHLLEFGVGTTTLKSFPDAIKTAEALSRKNKSDVIIYLVETEANGVIFYDKLATFHPHPKEPK